LKPRLRSSLSTPLQVENALIGVLTVYSTHREAFTEDHRRIVEVIARQVSRTVKHAIDFQRHRITTFRDRLTGLPNLQHLERFITSEMAFGAAGTPLSIIFIDVRSLGVFDRGSGRGQAASDQTLADVADAIRKALRGADVLFRYGEFEFVVLLTQTSAEIAAAVLKRIEARLLETNFEYLEDEQPTPFIGLATAPSDGTTLGELVQVARRRESPPGPKTTDRPSSIH
jgi:diguanylate cyclase (GGDEF)-like protein